MKKKLNGIATLGVCFVLLALVSFLVAIASATSEVRVERKDAIPEGGSGLALLAVGIALISSRRSIMQCPECESLESKPLDRKGAGMNYWYIDDRKCGHCGADWTPATPRRVALVLAILGAALAAGLGWATVAGIQTVSEKRGDGYFIWPFGVVIGILTFTYGIRVLLGKAGKVKIHKTGNSNDAQGL